MASIDIASITRRSYPQPGAPAAQTSKTYDNYINDILYGTDYGNEGARNIPSMPLGAIPFNTWHQAAAASPQANPFDFGGVTSPYDALAEGQVPTPAYQNSSYDLLQQYLPAPFTAEANTPAPVPYAPIQVYNPYAPANQFGSVTNPYLSWGGM